MALQNLATYSPLDVVVIITQASTNFSHQVVGFMSDSFVTVARDSDTFDHETGVDDFSTRVYHSNKSGKITLSLQQSSPSNDVLTALHNRDVALRNNSGLFEITVKDGSGRSVYTSQEAYIGKVPDSAFGSGVQAREWVINATRVQSLIGGNSLVNPEDVDALGALDTTIAPEWKR